VLISEDQCSVLSEAGAHDESSQGSRSEPTKASVPALPGCWSEGDRVAANVTIRLGKPGAFGPICDGMAIGLLDRNRAKSRETGTCQVRKSFLPKPHSLSWIIGRKRLSPPLPSLMQLFGDGNCCERVPTEGSWIGLGCSIRGRIHYRRLEHVHLLNQVVWIERQRRAIGRDTNVRDTGDKRRKTGTRRGAKACNRRNRDSRAARAAACGRREDSRTAGECWNHLSSPRRFSTLCSRSLSCSNNSSSQCPSRWSTSA
jgi:hypothetical protein